jgi:hypothetical protein
LLCGCEVNEDHNTSGCSPPPLDLPGLLGERDNGCRPGGCRSGYVTISSVTEVDTASGAVTFSALARRVPGAVLLSGVVGSKAYAMDTDGSDVDRLGVYAAPTVAFHGLDLPVDKAATVVFKEPDPDYQVHEARKFVRLAMSSNPTATELLWLDPGLYEKRTPLGDGLIGLRGCLATARLVRKA